MHQHTTDNLPKQAQQAMNLSLAASFLMILGKVAAYHITGSVAILSDAAESVIHIIATGVAALSLWYAALPADKKHPYGHGRIAFLSIGFEGAIIIAAAIYIYIEAARAFILGPELHQLDVGLVITGSLGLVNLFLGTYLVRVGKKTSSLVLISNGKHVLTDMWTSFSVVVGIAIVWLTDIIWLDPVIACIAATQICITGFKLLKQAGGQALDGVEARDTETIIKTLEELKEAGTLADYHQLRHRRINDARWIELHILLDGNLPLYQAHSFATKVENALNSAFSKEQVYITSHLEPEDHDSAHPGGHTKEDPLV